MHHLQGRMQSQTHYRSLSVQKQLPTGTLRWGRNALREGASQVSDKRARLGPPIQTRPGVIATHVALPLTNTQYCTRPELAIVPIKESI